MLNVFVPNRATGVKHQYQKTCVSINVARVHISDTFPFLTSGFLTFKQACALLLSCLKTENSQLDLRKKCKLLLGTFHYVIT